MKNKKYNGWNTYATWLVNVLIISDIRWDDYEEPITSDYLEEIVEDIVFNNTVEKDCLQLPLLELFYVELIIKNLPKLLIVN